MRGFWKGLAAPLMLFTTFDLPAQAQPQQFQPLTRRASGGVASDWVKVGQQIRHAAKKERDAGRT